MKNLFICYSRWTTCRKAKAWLEEKGIEFEYRDIKDNNPTVEELRDWIGRSEYPIKSFFNTSGKVYRELGLKDKLSNMTDEEKIEVLSTDGMLVKRPIFVGKEILVGFKEEDWENKL